MLHKLLRKEYKFHLLANNYLLDLSAAVCRSQLPKFTA